jgi:hypothetical protein
VNLSIGSKSFHVSWALLIGAFVAFMLLMHLSASGGDAVDQWVASADRELTANRIWARRWQDLAKQAQLMRQQAARWQDSSMRAGRRFAELAAAYQARLDTDTMVVPEQVHELHELVGACEQALTACAARGDALARSDSLERLRGDSLMQRLAQVDSVLAAGLTVQQCRFLHFFGCPSRGQSFAIGAASAGILAIFLTR